MRALCYATESTLWLTHPLQVVTAFSCPHKGEPNDLRLKFKSEFNSSLAFINIEGPTAVRRGLVITKRGALFILNIRILK